MSAPDYVVPVALRGGRFVPRNRPGRREPMRVTPGAFKAAGLPVPEDPRQQNSYQLSRRQGWPWSPALDEHVHRRGAELLGHGDVVLVDIDMPAAVDGSPMVDSLRWLSDRAVEAGELLDLSATVTVRTPGHGDTGHLPGWHLWYRADPDRPVRMGPLARCRAVELRSRGTCPGSPGYAVLHAPDDVPVLPRWIAALAGSPRKRPFATGTGRSSGRVWPRLHGLVAHLLEAEAGERNRCLYWAACRAGELVAAGELDGATAEKILASAAAELGLVREDGENAIRATIRSGLGTAAQIPAGGAA